MAVIPSKDTLAFMDARLEKEVRFSFAASQGPGGQHVNKVHTRAVLKWNLEATTLLGTSARARFREQYANRLNKDGDVVLASDQSRSREANKAHCLKRLWEWIAHARIPPVKRVATKPSKSAKKKRLDSKKKQAAKKKSRSWNPDD